MIDYHLNHLKELEAESIYVLQAPLQVKNLLAFLCGKDSIVVLHLALKAFYPASVPFTLLHVDTGHFQSFRLQR